MPTAHPRYQVTETAALARALQLAEREWPGEPRSRLIERLAATGAEQLAARQGARDDERVVAMDALADMFTGTFAPDYLEALRNDWPE